MATYYQYDKDGVLQSTCTADPVVGQPFGHINVDHYLQRGDTVGAFLAQHDIIYPQYSFPTVYHGEGLQHDGASERYQEPSHDQYHADVRHPSEHLYESYSLEDDSQFDHPQMPVGMSAVPPHKGYEWWPHPDDVRHHNTLYSLLPHLDPARRYNSHFSQWLDVIEEGSGNVFYRAVSKRLLVLFIGSKNLRQHLTSHLSRLRLVIPRGVSSSSAWRILIAWMKRATLPHYARDMEQFQVPHNTYAACTLAQTLEFLGLCKDAYRVDMTISQDHFVRPIYSVELKQLWNRLGPDNRYTRAAAKAVQGQMRAYEKGEKGFRWACEDITKFLEWYPEMKAAVMGNDGQGRGFTLRSVEEETPREDPNAVTIASRRGKAKVLRIVVDSKNPGEPSGGQEPAEGPGEGPVEGPTEECTSEQVHAD